jgi:alkylhydroperoxidase family enzyme
LALGDPDLVAAVLADDPSAPLSEGLRTTLTMLARLTASPEAFTRADVDRVRAAGVGDEAIADAITVCALFNMIDRCADALGFAVPPGFDGRRLLESGYLMPPQPPDPPVAAV